jgi:multisubunit Na+/H+ antiporter MnhB subunit
MKRSMRLRRNASRLLHLGLVLLLAGAGIALWLLIASLPRGAGLAPAVAAAVPDSGVESELTAVLLSFRGYDTLLEMTVLTAALAGVWSLGPAPRLRVPLPGTVLLGMNRTLLPVVILISGYLLWAGGAQAGGAFQAGAVLAAAGVLLLLAGATVPDRLRGPPVRAVVIIGLAVFLAIALGVMRDGRRFLEYPATGAGVLMLAIEAACALSIAAILAGMLAGGRPGES